MFSKLYIALLFVLISTFGACQQPKTPKNEATKLSVKAFFKYNLEHPDDIYDLPPILNEISGLGVYKDSLLVCIQDEKGVLFFYGIQSKDLEYSINFSADGDYEGVTCVEETIYALRADGVLFRVMNWDTTTHKKLIVKVLDTPLDEANDTEGLTYDPISKNLLIACKGIPKIAQKDKKIKNIYTYNLKNMAMEYEPVYTLDKKEYKNFVKDYLKDTKDYEDLHKGIKKAKGAIPIEPSAIAIHPITNHIYILAAVGNNLIVLNRSGEFKHIVYLSPKQFEQPEGIAFSSNGDLFISSEGKKEKASIFKFEWKKDD